MYIYAFELSKQKSECKYCPLCDEPDQKFLAMSSRNVDGRIRTEKVETSTKSVVSSKAYDTKHFETILEMDVDVEVENKNLATAAELIFNISKECFKTMADKLFEVSLLETFDCDRL